MDTDSSMLEGLADFEAAIPEIAGVNPVLVRIVIIIGVFLLLLLLRRLLIFLILSPLRRRLRDRGQLHYIEALERIIVRPIRLIIIALLLVIAGSLLLETGPLLTLVLRIASTFLIIAIAIGLYQFISFAFLSRGRLYTLTGMAVEEALLPFFRTSLQVFLALVAGVILIQEWGYDVTGLIAGLGIGGLAVSLAAQDTLSNLFGFTAIVGDRPFVVGDYIKTPDVEGIVEEVGLRSTRVRQLDQALVTVPNNKLAGAAVLNWSRLSKRRIDMVLNVTYDTRADALESLLEDLRRMLREWPSVETESVVVYFVEFGSYSLNILIRCYVTIADWGSFTAEKEKILLAILRLVDQHNIEIAFPSQTLYSASGTGEELATVSPDMRARLAAAAAAAMVLAQQAERSSAPKGDSPS